MSRPFIVLALLFAAAIAFGAILVNLADRQTEQQLAEAPATARSAAEPTETAPEIVAEGAASEDVTPSGEVQTETVVVEEIAEGESETLVVVEETRETRPDGTAIVDESVAIVELEGTTPGAGTLEAQPEVAAGLGSTATEGAGGEAVVEGTAELQLEGSTAEGEVTSAGQRSTPEVAEAPATPNLSGTAAGGTGDAAVGEVAQAPVELKVDGATAESSEAAEPGVAVDGTTEVTLEGAAAEPTPGDTAAAPLGEPAVSGEAAVVELQGRAGDAAELSGAEGAIEATVPLGSAATDIAAGAAATGVDIDPGPAGEGDDIATHGPAAAPEQTIAAIDPGEVGAGEPAPSAEGRVGGMPSLTDGTSIGAAAEAEEADAAAIAPRLQIGGTDAAAAAPVGIAVAAVGPLRLSPAGLARSSAVATSGLDRTGVTTEALSLPIAAITGAAATSGDGPDDQVKVAAAAAVAPQSQTIARQAADAGSHAVTAAAAAPDALVATSRTIGGVSASGSAPAGVVAVVASPDALAAGETSIAGIRADAGPVAAAAVTAAPGDPPPHAIAIKAVEAEADRLFVAGVAPPGMLVRIYTDDTLVGQARAGPSGVWLLEAKKDVRIGETMFRAEAASEDAASRMAVAAVPFVRHADGIVLEPAGAAATGEKGLRDLSVEPPVPVYAIIRRGDSLWRIARRNYGRGIKYRAIFAANRERIRNPHWIFPGQVFVIPASDNAWKVATH